MYPSSLIHLPFSIWNSWKEQLVTNQKHVSLLIRYGNMTPHHLSWPSSGFWWGFYSSCSFTACFLSTWKMFALVCTYAAMMRQSQHALLSLTFILCKCDYIDLHIDSVSYIKWIAMPWWLTEHLYVLCAMYFLFSFLSQRYLQVSLSPPYVVVNYTNVIRSHAMHINVDGTLM